MQKSEVRMQILNPLLSAARLMVRFWHWSSGERIVDFRFQIADFNPSLYAGRRQRWRPVRLLLSAAERFYRDWPRRFRLGVPTKIGFRLLLQGQFPASR